MDELPEIELPVILTFLWESVTPDKRQWKPSMPVLKPVNIYVQVSVPRFLTVPSNDTELAIFLTPTGMRYAIDQLESVMSEHPIMTERGDDKEEWEEEAKTETAELEKEEWEDVVKPEVATSEDEDWE